MNVNELIDAAKELLADGNELVNVYARVYGCAIPSSAINGLKKAVEAFESSDSIHRYEAVNSFHVAAWDMTNFGHYCPAGSGYLQSMLEAARRAAKR